MIQKSRKIQLPKGWTFIPNETNINQFYIILDGELTYEISNQQSKKQKKEKIVDLQAILRGEKAVQKEDRVIIQLDAAKRKIKKEHQKQNQLILNKKMILSQHQFFAEENFIRLMSHARDRWLRQFTYKVTAHTWNTEVLVFEADQLMLIFK